MPQYLLSVMHDADVDPRAAPPEETAAMFATVGAFNDRLRESGAWVFAGGLHGLEAATVVDATGPGEPVVTDGPYVEAKEWLGGFWIVEAADLDAALGWAVGGSAACGARVEVRPFED